MKNILVAVSGLTPQVVSETLFCLSVQKKIRIDEIFVITTTEGKRNIEKYFFKNRKSGRTEGPFSLKEEINNLCKLYKIKTPVFNIKSNVIVASEENVKMHDVRTDKDNILFPNVVTNVLKTITADDRNMLYCSLSGGRKTMSAYLGFALSLYAREGDKLFHVLASSEFENTGRFYPLSKNKKDLILSEVPFIKLRPVLKDKLDYKNKTYSEIIEQSQIELERLNEDGITIDIKKHLLSFKGKTVRIPATHLAFYLFFINLKRKGVDGFDIENLDSENNNYVKEIYEIYLKLIGKTAKEYESTFNETQLKKKWFKFGIEKPLFRQNRSKINDIIEELFENEEWLTKNFTIEKSGPHRKSEYTIYAPLEKFRIQ